jgi:hypothetical protein
MWRRHAVYDQGKAKDSPGVYDLIGRWRGHWPPITLSTSIMRAASTAPQNPYQTCALTLELLAGVPSLSSRTEATHPSRVPSLVHSCKAVPSGAPETNSNHVLAKTAPSTKELSSSAISDRRVNTTCSYTSARQTQCTIEKPAKRTVVVVPTVVTSPAYWNRAKTNLEPPLTPP